MVILNILPQSKKEKNKVYHLLRKNWRQAAGKILFTPKFTIIEIAEASHHGSLRTWYQVRMHLLLLCSLSLRGTAVQTMDIQASPCGAYIHSGEAWETSSK